MENQSSRKKYFHQGVFITLFGGTLIMVLMGVGAGNMNSQAPFLGVAILTYLLIMSLFWQKGRSSKHRKAISIMMFLSLVGGIGINLLEDVNGLAPDWVLTFLSFLFLLNFFGIGLLYSIRHFQKNPRPWQAYLKWVTLMVITGALLLIVASTIFQAMPGSEGMLRADNVPWMEAILGFSPLVFAFAHLSELLREAKHPSYQDPYQSLIDQIDASPEPSEDPLS